MSTTPRSTQHLAGAVLLLALAVAACEDDPIAPLGNECSTDITAANDGSFVELCSLSSGTVHHVRIENFRAPATHASVQVVFGFDTPPAGPTDPLAADQFRVLLYGGGPPGVPALAQVSYGDVDAALDGGASFINAGATVCFDIYDGTASTAPSFIIWVDGQEGADCDVPATLTAGSAYGARTHWSGATGAISKDAKVYFRQAAGTGATPKVTLFADAILDEATIAGAATCTTAWANTADWQPLCDPAAGMVRHVRLESVSSSANNGYFYAVLGQTASPTGNPAVTANSGKLIVTGGRANDGSSWTWFRFGGNGTSTTTTQFNYATSTPQALYTQVAATICFDTGAKDDGDARFVFWATGANGANCSNRSTLTLANALYDSTTDPTTSGIWDIPYATGLLNFIKTNNNAGVAMTNAVAFSEPAVLF